MRDTAVAPGLFGGASGCGVGGRHKGGCEGGTVGVRRAPAGPAEPAGLGLGIRFAVRVFQDGQVDPHA